MMRMEGHSYVQAYEPCVRAGLASAQVILDEVIFTPVHIAAFFSYLTLVEGGDWEVRMRVAGSRQCTISNRSFSRISTLASQACKQKLRQDYWPTLVTELIIWPPYQVTPLPLSGLRALLCM